VSVGTPKPLVIGGASNGGAGSSKRPSGGVWAETKAPHAAKRPARSEEKRKVIDGLRARPCSAAARCRQS
jgi:hypothetical protein